MSDEDVKEMHDGAKKAFEDAVSETNATIEAIKTVRHTIIGVIVAGTLLGGGWLYVQKQPSSPAPQPTADLAKLVDSEARPYLHGFYRDLAHVVSTQAIQSTGSFRNTYRRAVGIAQQTSELPSIQPIDEPISKRIEIAVGMDDRTLDESTRAALVGVLEQVAEEFE